MLIEALSFLFIADDVAMISVPTPNLMLHSNNITYIDKALIIVGTILGVLFLAKFHSQLSTVIIVELMFC